MNKMTPDLPQQSGRWSGAGRQGFLKLARQVSETIGTEFFSLLVNQLRGVLGADCVYIGEFKESGRVQTIATSRDGEPVESFEFPLADSHASEVALGNLCMYAKAVRDAFPGDLWLRDLEAEACVCIPLNNAEGQACGLIAALYCQPLSAEIHFIQSMLTMFAPRASAELNRRHADEALRESEERYRAFVQSCPDACWRVEFDQPIDTSLPEEEQLAQILQSGRLAECNEALVLRLGIEPANLIGKAPSEVVFNMEAARRSILSMIRSQYRHATIEVTTVDHSRKRRYFSDSYWAIIENGKLRRIWGSSRDLTELRNLETQFRHAQKLDSIGKLAGGVAHDFNNLLNVIHAYSSKMLEHADATDPAYVGLTEIQKAAEKGAALTSQLLAFSRRQNVQLTLLDLNPIVKEDERMLRRLIGDNIELITELNPSLGLVRGDTGYMHQVLLNLAVNSRDAMPKGGKLIISLSNVDIKETPSAVLGAMEAGSYVRLRVTDTGTGMNAEVQEHLFEPFFTTKDPGQGTGLGLSTVYGIVRQMGGRITVETGPNKGTTFEIFFPRASSQQAAGSVMG